jgi:S-adenosylmethionine decarboxylase
MSLGKHVLIEALGPISQQSCDEIETLLLAAADAAGATVVNSHLHPFGEGYGVSGALILAESHISIHTWPEHGYASLDIYMCGDCDPMVAANFIASQSCVEKTIMDVINRGYERFNISLSFQVNDEDKWVSWWLKKAPLLKNRLVNNLGINENQVTSAIQECIRFLYLCRRFPGVLTPSIKIDKIWHQCIVFTRIYEEFCLTALGRVIHYQPSDDPVAQASQFNKTRSLYNTVFGNQSSWIWEGDAASCSGD